MEVVSIDLTDYTKQHLYGRGHDFRYEWFPFRLSVMFTNGSTYEPAASRSYRIKDVYVNDVRVNKSDWPVIPGSPYGTVDYDRTQFCSKKGFSDNDPKHYVKFEIAYCPNADAACSGSTAGTYFTKPTRVGLIAGPDDDRGCDTRGAIPF